MNQYQGAEQPNHTQTPNSFYDELLPQITSLCELKVTLAIMRQTFGWHKQEDKLSLTQLEKLTGLSRQGVIEGIELGMKRGSIIRRPAGQGFVYSLKLVNNLDQSEAETSQQFRLEVVNDLDRPLVNNLDPQKKGRKKVNKQPAVGVPPAAALYQKIVKRPPDKAQRELINSKVTDFTTWEAVLRQFAAEGRPPQRIDWLLERYEKAIAARASPVESKEAKQERLKREWQEKGKRNGQPTA